MLLDFEAAQERERFLAPRVVVEDELDDAAALAELARAVVFAGRAEAG